MQEKINTTKEENKKLCDKYPFLVWYSDPLYGDYDEDTEIDYTFTGEYEMPEGWRKAFCPEIWDELKAILEKADYVDKFRFVQIKEKYGTLRLYYDGVPEKIYAEIEAWESKYEDLSEKTCICCGKSAKYRSINWISPWCEDCAKKINQTVIKIEDAENFYSVKDEDRKKFIVKF